MLKLTTTRVILEKSVYISRRHYFTVKKTSLEFYIKEKQRIKCWPCFYIVLSMFHKGSLQRNSNNLIYLLSVFQSSLKHQITAAPLLKKILLASLVNIEPIVKWD